MKSMLIALMGLALAGTAGAGVHLQWSDQLHRQVAPAPVKHAAPAPANVVRVPAAPAVIKVVRVPAVPAKALRPVPLTAPAAVPAATLTWEPAPAPVTQQPYLIQAEPIKLNAMSALVLDQQSGRALLAKNADVQTPIASITKLMTAMLVFDARLDPAESIEITEADRDTLKWSGSRLAIGSAYSREQLLHLALIASDNRAAHALGRTYPGGMTRFVANMNRTARALGLTNTSYVEPTGLSSENRSTAHDLARLVNYAHHNYPEIRQITSSSSYHLDNQRVVVKKKNRKARVYYRNVAFNNTNRLTRSGDWEIGLSKTGFINEAGHCVVMQARIAGRDTIIVLLDAQGNSSRAGDAARIKTWLESQEPARQAVLDDAAAPT